MGAPATSQRGLCCDGKQGLSSSPYSNNATKFAHVWKKLCQPHSKTNEFLLCGMIYGFFFHEYGRRVGMVPRSSLKGGKNSLMVEKRTRTSNTTQTKQPKARRSSLHLVVFPLCQVNGKRKRVTGNGPEFTNGKHYRRRSVLQQSHKKGFKGTLLHDCK